MACCAGRAAPSSFRVANLSENRTGTGRLPFACKACALRAMAWDSESKTAEKKIPGTPFACDSSASRSTAFAAALRSHGAQKERCRESPAELVAESVQVTAAHSAELARRLARGEDSKNTPYPKILERLRTLLVWLLGFQFAICASMTDQHGVEPKQTLCHVAAAAACSAARRSACAFIPTDPPRSSNSAPIMNKIPTTIPSREKASSAALRTCSDSTGPAALPEQSQAYSEPCGEARPGLSSKHSRSGRS